MRSINVNLNTFLPKVCFLDEQKHLITFDLVRNAKHTISSVLQIYYSRNSMLTKFPAISMHIKLDQELLRRVFFHTVSLIYYAFIFQNVRTKTICQFLDSTSNRKNVYWFQYIFPFSYIIWFYSQKRIIRHKGWLSLLIMS